jgi:hypothetical protein
MIDSRNKYGARGGYVDSDYDYDSRRGRDYADERRDYDMRRDYDYDMRREDYDMRRGSDYDMRRGDMRAFDVRGYYDGHNKKYLDDKMLEKWSKRLMKEVEEKDKQFLKMENIVKRAENMGIKFEEFTPDEFYVTLLMLFTDFSKALGTVNPDIFIKLAKYWLCDEDAGLQYGEKLAAYYYHIVEA